MKIKGRILSLLCLSSISFSTFAIFAVCPDPKFLNTQPQFLRNGRAEAPRIGVVTVRYYPIEGSGQLYNEKDSAKVLGGQFICTYTAGSKARGIYVVITSATKNWKIVESSQWIDGSCNPNIKLCDVTNQ
jgi:hypothetical protein